MGLPTAKDLTRRSFLKGSAITAAAAAAMGTLGACSSGTQTASTGETSSDVSVAEDNISNQVSFLHAPARIPDDEIVDTVDADIVVVGAGIGGLYAALGGVEAGGKVIVLEKGTVSRTGGSDIAAFGSSVQKDLGIDLDIQEMLRRYYKHVDFNVNQELISRWAYGSGELIDKTLQILKPAGVGAEIRLWPYPEGWNPADELCEIWPVAHSFAPIGEFADNSKFIIEPMTEYLIDEGVEFRYSTPGVQLVQEADGNVTGVIAETSDGYVRFNASKGVLLATGDMGGNPEMMAYYYDEAMAGLCASNNAYTSYMEAENVPDFVLNSGDGHQMALWAGGVMQGQPFSSMAVATWNLCSPFMHVNANGDRFHNEDSQEGLWPRDILKQPGGVAWIIYDSKWADDVERVTEWGMWGANPDDGSNPDYSADTIEELATLIDVPAENLKRSVETRNQAASSGVDTRFAMKGEHITTIDAPPFCASKLGMYYSCATSGVRVSPDSEVLDAKSQPIVGLYAVGNVVGEKFGDAYYPFFSGMANGLAMTTGYFGAQHAMARK